MSKLTVNGHDRAWEFKVDEVEKVEVDEGGRLSLLDDADELVALFNVNEWVAVYVLEGSGE